jgi:adenine phosphoribosyltransferase
MIDLKSRVRAVPDFPIEGIIFRDITTLLQDRDAYRSAIERLHDQVKDLAVDLVVGMESRGFIFAAPLAYLLRVGFVPVRKLGKLPAETLSVEYELEYGTNTLEIHRDAIAAGQRVLVVDDLLATGGTVAATVDLVRQLGGEVVGTAFLIELPELGRPLPAGRAPGLHGPELLASSDTNRDAHRDRPLTRPRCARPASPPLGERGPGNRLAPIGGEG